MKRSMRILSLIIAFITVLSLFSCSPSDDGTVKPPQNNGGSSQNNGGSSQNNGGGSDAIHPTFLSRAVELAESVDAIPTSVELHGEGVGAKLLSSPLLGNFGVSLLSDSVGGSDVSDPKNNSDYQWYLQTDRLTHDMYYTMSGYGDEVIESVKIIKKIAVENIVQLNTWVTGFTSQFAEHIRMNYDSANDVVIIEAITTINGPTARYCKINATYDKNGKAIVDAYMTDVVDGKLDREYNVYYAEDDEWNVVCYNSFGELPHQYSYMSHADLSVKERSIITYLLGGAAFKMKGEEGTPNIYFVTEYDSGLIYDGQTGQYIKGEPKIGSQSFYLANSNNERVGMIHTYEKHISLTLDAYEMKGWNKLLLNGSEYTLQIGDVLYGGDFKSIDVGGKSAQIAIQNNHCPSIYISFELGNNASVESEIKKILSEIGLAFKDSACEKLLSLPERAHDLRAKFEIAGVDGNYMLTNDFFVESIDKFIVHPNTPEEIMAFLSQPKVPIEQQTDDSSYYEIYNATLDGKASIDPESGNVDLSAISISLSGSALLVRDGKYAVCAVISNGFESRVISSAEATWNGGDLKISGLSKFDLHEVELGEYSIRIYLAKVGSDSSIRISPILSVGVSDTLDFELEQDGNIIAVNATAEEILVNRFVKPEEEKPEDDTTEGDATEGEITEGETTEDNLKVPDKQ